MDITFACGSCGQGIVIDEAGAGFQVKCPKCGQTLTVPREDAEHPKAATTAPPQAAASVSETKRCPFCAETIKRDASVCGFCGRNLAPIRRASYMMPLWGGILLVVVLLFALTYAYHQHRETTAARYQGDLALAAAKARMTQLESNLQAMASQAQEEKAKAAAHLAAEAARDAEKKTVAPFFAAAEEALAATRKINSAIKVGAKYDAYSEQLLQLAAKGDELERAAKETGLAGKDLGAERLCSAVRLIVSEHQSARNSWEGTLKVPADDPAYQLAMIAAREAGSYDEQYKIRLKAIDTFYGQQKKDLEAMQEMWNKAVANSEEADTILKVLRKQYGLQ